MNLLLDTHALIWFGENDPKLSFAARQAIESPDNVRFVSIATCWEMAIKCSIGKLLLQKQLADIVRELQANGFDLLGIEPEHTLKIEVLPFLHRDPFDRMLVAQAIVNDLTLISNEAVFDEYGAKRLWRLSKVFFFF